MACGISGDDAAATDRAYAAESLVVGDWLSETGLIVLSRSGDRPELRAASDPSLLLWRREGRLPAIATAAAIGARSLVFSTRRGDAYRWDLANERADALANVRPGTDMASSAERSAVDGSAAFWEEDRIVVVDEAGERSYTAPTPVIWAAPTPDRGVVALSGGESGPVLLALNEGSEVVSEVGLAVRAPGHVTAWGAYVLFHSADGLEVVIVRIPELEEVGRHEFRRPVSALAISGSSHEYYAAHSSGRIEAVNRISGNRRELARLPGDISELRPGIYGQLLLAVGSEGVYRVSLSGDPPVRLPIDWRADLPLGLPSGDILGARGDSLYVVRVSADAGVALEAADAPADAWWLPVRWSSTSPRLASERDREDARTDSAASASEPGDEGDEGTPPEVAADASSDSSTAGEGEAAMVGGPPADSIGFSFTAPAAGYYAVAVASRTAGGVIALVRTLARSGYPTAVQRRRDDGGQMWYRALVGPYPVRERAEASARQLRRERDLDAWVIELTAGTVGELQPDSR
jgi:cell division septation protein DedD